MSDEKYSTNVNIMPQDDFEAGTVETTKRQELNVFSDNAEGPDFRGVSCVGAAVLIAKAQMGLGILGLPQTLQTLGFVPGVLVLVILSALSTWTGVVIGQFRLNHPQIHSVADAAYLLFGRVGREVIGVAYWLFYTVFFSAGILTLSIAFNTLVERPVCATVWVAALSAGILGLVIAIRTLRILSWLGYSAIASIFVAVWIVAISCLAQSRPAAADADEVITKNVQAVAKNPSFASISAAVCTQITSLAGAGGFFTIHAEMKDQTKYVKSLLLGQGFIVFNYIAISCIVYGKVGDYLTSPALGSAGPLIMKIAYGFALPALIFTPLYMVHIPTKYSFVRILRGTEHLQSNSMIHWITWSGMTCLCVGVGFLIATSIPFFDALMALLGAVFGTTFTLIVPGFMFLYDMAYGFYPEGGASANPIIWLKHSHNAWFVSRTTALLAAIAWFCIIGGIYASVSGLYGTIVEIITSYETGAVGTAFSCEFN